MSELRAAIEAAELEERMWALLVEHMTGAQELHTWEDNAMLIFTPAAVEPMRDWLLQPDPVPCNEAAAAGIDLLADCNRCREPGP